MIVRRVGSDGFLDARTVVDLTAIPDPDLVSLPAIHPGDVRLGDPFGVACESVEAIHPLDGSRLLVGDFKPGDRIKVVADDGHLEFAKK